MRLNMSVKIMDKPDERVVQLEDELRVLKLQLQQSQTQLNMVISQGKAEKERLQASLNSMLNGTLYHSVRNAHTGILHFDYVSGTWEKILGVSAEDSISDSQNVFANIEADDLKRLKESIYDPPEPTAFNIEVRYNHPVSKKLRWLQITSNPFREGDHIFSDGFIFDITTRKEAERNFDFEQKRLNALNNMPDGSLYRTVRDMKTGILRFEHLYGKWEEISGVTVEESLADIRNVFGRIEPGDLQRLMQAIEKSLNPLKSFEIECRYHHPKRKGECWILISSHPRVEDDEIVADGFIFDITERKRTEQKLNAEKKRLQSIGDNIPGGALFQLIRDSQTDQLHFSYTSATWNDVTGIPADLATANILNVFETLHPDDLPILIQSIEESARTMNDIYVEIRTNGGCWLRFVARPRCEDTYIVWDGIITNITARKKIEHELETEKMRLQNMGDNIPAGSLYQFIRDKKTRQLRMSYVSASWEDVVGISAEVTLNDVSAVFANIHHDDLEIFIKAIDESEHTMADFRQEMRMGDRWLQCFSRPRCEEDIIVWDGIIMNITASKEADAELAQYRHNLEQLVQERTDELIAVNEELTATNEEMNAVNEELYTVNEKMEATNEKLTKYQTELEMMVDERTKELVVAKDKAEESDRLKSAFLANMSHEIRTPLNGIVGFLQFLDSDNLSPSNRREYINVIKNSSTQLTKIIDDIIDVSKIEARLLIINPVSIRLNELMNEMHLFFETFLQSKNKEHINLILDESGFIDDCLICVDAVRFRQVITNILGNAVKFTDKGYIRFGYHQSAPDMLEFVIEDSGIGLSENQMNQIFERFFQADLDNNRLYSGTGLGLHISRSLVQLMGGRIWVESTENFGSTFYFTISYLPVEPEDEHIFSGIPVKRSSSDERFAGKTILLVEPIPMKSIYYEKMISTTGATVIKAENLEEWSDRLSQIKHLDMVIVEGSLFDNEDNEQIEHIINVRNNLPVVLVVSEEKQIRQNLCHTTIENPVGYAKILKILEDIL